MINHTFIATTPTIAEDVELIKLREENLVLNEQAKAEREHRFTIMNMHRDLSTKIHDFFGSYIIDNDYADSYDITLEEINTFLADCGMAQFLAPKRWAVTGTAHVDFTVYVEATTEEEAREMVDLADFETEVSSPDIEDQECSVSYIDINGIEVDE